MNIRAEFRNLLSKATSKRVVGKKQFITSYVSLFVFFVLLVTTTVSWFTIKDSATIDGSTFSLSASSGLRVNQGEDKSGQVRLATDVKLAEASSVDGRNIYFPTTGTFSNTTSEMTFREGNVGDKNKLYYYNDFSLNSTESGKTDVYVKAYEVTVTTTENKKYVYDGSEKQEATKKCPLRIAFIKDSADTSSIKVIDPTALLKEYSTAYKSVSSTNSIGSPVISDSKSTSFMQYYYGNEPLFTLDGTDDLNVTMVIWLEGGDTSAGVNNCNEFAGASVNLNIQLESNWDNMEEIKFVDMTYNDDAGSGYGNPDNLKHWVTNGKDNKPGVCIVTVSYLEPSTNQWKFVEMTKSKNYDKDYTWSAYIPQGVTEYITFNRYNPEEQKIWNSWYTEPGVNNKHSDQIRKDLQESRVLTRSNGNKIRSLVYTATQGTGKGTDEAFNHYPSRGYWDLNGNDDAVRLDGDDTEPTTAAPTQAGTTVAPATTTPPGGNIKINSTLKDLTSTGWIETNVSENNCKLYIVFDNGASFVITRAAYKYFSGEGFTVASTAKLKGFELRNSSGITTNTFYLSSPIEIKNGDWYNFEINSSDQLIKQ